jgi:hypothetical protein
VLYSEVANPELGDWPKDEALVQRVPYGVLDGYVADS